MCVCVCVCVFVCVCVCVCVCDKWSLHYGQLCLWLYDTFKLQCDPLGFRQPNICKSIRIIVYMCQLWTTTVNFKVWLTPTVDWGIGFVDHDHDDVWFQFDVSPQTCCVQLFSQRADAANDSWPCTETPHFWTWTKCEWVITELVLCFFFFSLPPLFFLIV